MIRVGLTLALVACGRLNFEPVPFDGSSDGAPLPAVTRLVLGKGHGCGIRGGDLFCWGSNGSGQAGIGSFATVSSPQRVEGTGWTDVCAGNDHTCGIRDGTLFCWGSAVFGQLGNGVVTGQETTPLQISTSTWTDVTCDDGFTCALRVDGKVQCWGRNDKGELGIPSPTGSTAPVDVASGALAAIAAGKAFVVGLDASSGYLMWGSSEEGQRGDGTISTIDIPPQLVGLGFVVASISPGREHTCARSTTGAAACWGDNRSRQTGVDDDPDQPLPVQIFDSSVDVIACGGLTTCAIRGGKLSCWGSNEFGQLADPVGTGTQTGTAAPRQIGTDEDWTTVALGTDHVCGERAGGDVYCWGQNDASELGVGVTSPFEAGVVGPLVFP